MPSNRRQSQRPSTLASKLLAFLPEGARAALSAIDDPDELEQRLASWLQAGQESWPEVSFPVDDFLRDLAARLASESAPATALGSLRGRDLYLAWACRRGLAGAVEAFEASFLADLGAVLGKAGVAPSVAEEVKQLLRCQLFVARPASPPLIDGYAGRGGLRGWLRSIALRTAFKQVRRETRDIALDDRMLCDIRSPGCDPELAQLRAASARTFKLAFEQAMVTLNSRERNLLRQHFIDGLSIDELASLYRVHRATAARWLAGARAALLERTQEILRQQLRGQTGLASLLELARSQLDLSIHRLLRR